MTVQEIRRQFPILSRKVYGKPLVYFDNAATTQRPESVLCKWAELSSGKNANIHRAVHFLAGEATEEFEAARDAVKSFIHAACREEIIFTSGTTAAVNLTAFSFGEAFVREGDRIIVGEEEHHSDIVPWQMLCRRKKAELKVWKVDETGHLDLAELERLMTPETRLLAVAQVSNVLGLANEIDAAARICHSHGAKIFVDGAQGIVHQGIDVQKSDIDFYAFSGHKIFAAPGVGVLYGKREILDRLPPFMGGGEMIESVRFSGTTYAGLPYRFEAGTQNLAGVPTLVPALELAKRSADPEIRNAQAAVKEYLYQSLTSDSRIRLLGTTRRMEEKTGIFSFAVDGVHHEDLALILDKMGIAVRSGMVCAEPLITRFGLTGIVRASLAVYNTMEEAEYFMKALKQAAAMLA